MHDLTTTREWRQFASFQGADLRKLDDPTRRKVESFLEVVLPGWKAPSNADADYELWHLFNLEGKGMGSRYLLLEGRNAGAVPGSTEFRIHVFDERGRPVGKTLFSTGIREGASAAALRIRSGMDLPILEVSTSRGRQYYAVSDDRVVLIRYERDDWTPIRNSYQREHFRAGPQPPNRTEDEWEALLNSTNPIDVLEALTWLSGIHFSPRFAGMGDPNLEPLAIAEALEKLRNRRTVQESLGKLAKCQDPWVREAAELALTPKFDP